MCQYLRNVLLALFLTPIMLYGTEWKEFRLLKSYVKTSNIGKGRELINKCLHDSIFNTSPDLYSLATALEIKANDAENMKLYLHQQYDTTAFFNSVCNIFEYTLKEESLLRETNPKLAKKIEKKNHTMLKRYYPNLFSGGMFFVKNKKWESADRLFSMYIDVSSNEHFKDEKFTSMTRLARAAFWSMASNFEMKKYNGVFKYQSLAEADSANFDYALQYEALSFAEQRDTFKYECALKRGLTQSSFSDYFFSRLTDLWNNTRQYKKAFELNDSLLKRYPDNKLYLYGQTIVLFNMKQYERCLVFAERLLKLDPENSQACYYIGLCWFNQAVSYESTLSPNPTSQDYRKRREEVNQMYRTAMPYLEKYKDKNQKDKEKWQAPLYKIYFNLNMEDKLKELEN